MVRRKQTMPVRQPESRENTCPVQTAPATRPSKRRKKASNNVFPTGAVSCSFKSDLLAVHELFFVCHHPVDVWHVSNIKVDVNLGAGELPIPLIQFKAQHAQQHAQVGPCIFPTKISHLQFNPHKQINEIA